MERSEQINELALALAKAQGAIENAAKDSANPFFKSKYADLASVREAVRRPLADNGLCVVQSPAADGATVILTTLLAHASGQWISSSLTVTSKDDSAQAIGSAITYARRYALQSICGVAPEDDDGEGAMGRTNGQQQRPDQNGRWAQQSNAAQQVAQQKRQAMANGKSYAEVSSPDPRTERQQPEEEQLASSLANALKQFAAMKESIGSQAYHRILGGYGYEHANECKSLAKLKEIFKEMIAEQRFQAKQKAGENFQATDSDLPNALFPDQQTHPTPYDEVTR